MFVPLNVKCPMSLEISPFWGLLPLFPDGWLSLSQLTQSSSKKTCSAASSLSLTPKDFLLLRSFSYLLSLPNILFELRTCHKFCERIALESHIIRIKVRDNISEVKEHLITWRQTSEWAEEDDFLPFSDVPSGFSFKRRVYHCCCENPTTFHVVRQHAIGFSLDDAIRNPAERMETCWTKHFQSFSDSCSD